MGEGSAPARTESPRRDSSEAPRGAARGLARRCGWGGRRGPGFLLRRAPRSALGAPGGCRPLPVAFCRVTAHSGLGKIPGTEPQSQGIIVPPSRGFLCRSVCCGGEGVLEPPLGPPFLPRPPRTPGTCRLPLGLLLLL